jgi:hypothetical protein
MKYIIYILAVAMMTVLIVTDYKIYKIGLSIKDYKNMSCKCSSF